MALFKISKGSKNNLPATLTEGYCWYTFEDSKFYIDFKDENGVLTRKALNANTAETLSGMSLDELKAYVGSPTAITDEEIDEICSTTIDTFLSSIASEEVSF